LDLHHSGDVDTDGAADFDADNSSNFASIEVVGTGMDIEPAVALDTSMDLEDSDVGDFDHDFSASVHEANIPQDVLLQEHYEGGTSHEHSNGVRMADPGLKLFTLRGLIAFFSVSGWSGILFDGLRLPPALTFILAILLGFCSMLLIAYVMLWFMTLQQNGTVDIRSAVGSVGEVYLKIPPEGSGCGKVTVVVSGRLREFEAVSASKADIPTGAEILVVGVQSQDTLLVRQQNENL
jgi:hypothetical protein